MARSPRFRSEPQVFPAPELAQGRSTVAARPSASVRLGLARRSAAAAKSEAARSLQRFVRQEYWNGLAAGDVVRVAGHTARGRHWRFRAHVTNTSNGATWVEVALVDGPPPSRRPAPVAAPDGSVTETPRVEKVRSFDPGLVTPRWRARSRPRLLGRNATVAVADQLDELDDPQPSLF